MPELPSPTSAFDRLKSLFTKLIPILGMIVGVIAIGRIGAPIASAIFKFLNTQFGVSKSGSLTAGVSSADIMQLAWWVPTGMIVGGIAAVIGGFLRSAGGDIMSMIGNFALGFAAGALLGSFLIPFHEDIPFLNVLVGSPAI